MHETPHAYSHLDHPGEGTPRPAGAVALRGWLILPGHSRAISGGLQHLLVQPELLRAMSTQARIRVTAEYDAVRP